MAYRNVSRDRASGATVTMYPIPSTSSTCRPFSSAVWLTSADDVAVGVAVVVEHAHQAGAAGRDHDVVADRHRRAVLGRRVDVDADLGDVGLPTVGDRVVEDVRALGRRVEEELAVGGDVHLERVDRLALRSNERRLAADEEGVAVGIGVVVEQVEADRRADGGGAEVVAGVGLVVRVVEADVDDDRALGGGAVVVADHVRQLDVVDRVCSGRA